MSACYTQIITVIFSLPKDNILLNINADNLLDPERGNNRSIKMNIEDTIQAKKVLFVVTNSKYAVTIIMICAFIKIDECCSLLYQIYCQNSKNHFSLTISTQMLSSLQVL